MKSAFYYKTCIGEICISEENGKIVELNIFSGTRLKENIQETDLIKKTKTQLDEYFSGTRRNFDLPINIQTSEFRYKVWSELLKIPYGKTCSYRDIAVKIGNPNACRAVGNAIHLNPIMIIIPCHRVIGSNGSMTGYAWGIDVKRHLLDLENSYKD